MNTMLTQDPLDELIWNPGRQRARAERARGCALDRILDAGREWIARLQGREGAENGSTSAAPNCS